MALEPKPLRVAREVARELALRGAEAVVVVGSLARGEASPESDVDLLPSDPSPTCPGWKSEKVCSWA